MLKIKLDTLGESFLITKNAAYIRHQLSRPMRIVGPIQIWRGCVIYIIFFCLFFCLLLFIFHFIYIFFCDRWRDNFFHLNFFPAPFFLLPPPSKEASQNTASNVHLIPKKRSFLTNLRYKKKENTNIYKTNHASGRSAQYRVKRKALCKIGFLPGRTS